ALHRDLEAIVARATERRMTDRIASAGRLAEYLQLYLDGLPLPIRPPTAGELVWRWIREHRTLVATLTTAAIVLLATAFTAFVFVNRARQDAQRFYLLARSAVDRWQTGGGTALKTLEELRHVPGLEQVRKDLLEAAAADYRQ